MMLQTLLTWTLAVVTALSLAFAPGKALGPDWLKPTDRIRISFVGDCTLGSEEQYQNHPRNFVSMIANLGMEYPFLSVRAVFLSDDLTLANLEGTFTDRTRASDKSFVFRAPAEYAKILSLGGVEAVNLANNHTLDYGVNGLADTKQALSLAGVLYSGSGDLAVYESKGVRIGMTGYGYPHSNTAEALARDIPLLREMGCQIVIVSMHAGREESQTLIRDQTKVAHAAIDLGADVVVGHHPHVLQGIEIYEGKPILYSLGNFSFGGNANPDDWDTVLAQMEFDVHEDGTVSPVLLRLLPCVISGA
nr:CapA family protein [Clostridia bacterium]